MHTAYLDCFSGASGDMLLGALIDAGLSMEKLRNTINALNIRSCEIAASRVTINSLSATRVKVSAPEKQPHRHLQDIEKIIDDSQLNPDIQKKAVTVFRALAKAEAAVHGCSVEEVHFHEVGAVDALVDIVGTIAGFHDLGITRIACSPLPMPRGWVNCAHGELPVPAPATCKLLEGKPVYGVELDQELITPTGAALLHVLVDEFGPLPPLTIKHIGYGAGSNQREDGRPNLLRLIIGRAHQPDEAQQVEVIETALDDWNPETWPHVAEQLFQHGALDVILIPVQMKKGRPGFLLKVICETALEAIVKQTILSETSSIGLRFHTEQRFTLPREIITLETGYGPVQAKKIATPDGPVITPEFEECRRVALEKGVPIKEVYSEIIRSTKSPE